METQGFLLFHLMPFGRNSHQHFDKDSLVRVINHSYYFDHRIGYLTSHLWAFDITANHSNEPAIVGLHLNHHIAVIICHLNGLYVLETLNIGTYSESRLVNFSHQGFLPQLLTYYSHH